MEHQPFSAAFAVPRETLDLLGEFVKLVLAENQTQNLVAKSTEAVIWDRHILDSAQLVGLDGHRERTWLDVGSGAGFPGMVVAIILQMEHILVEPRRRRAEFLARAADLLGLSGNVSVVQSNVEKVRRMPVGTITARAVTTIHDILVATHHLADVSTTWLLHKGRNAAEELEHATAQWNARFETLPSITNAEAAIVRVTGLSRRRVP